jgi:hypothetical protein
MPGIVGFDGVLPYRSNDRRRILKTRRQDGPEKDYVYNPGVTLHCSR